MKLLFWDLGMYVGRVFLALLVGGGIILVATVLAFIFWDKADILKEESEERGSSVIKGTSIVWRVLAIAIAIVGCLWGLSAFIDLIKFLF
ncbi:MAG: hypothetical protein N3C62_04385 [Synergistetes bacterium]|nr:hypothetical protein [Synergistota bacterium]